MSKQCKICTDQFETPNGALCPKCYRLTRQGVDRLEICMAHAERIPERAERYLAQAELFRQEILDKSPDAKKELRTNRRLAALVMSIKPHKPRRQWANSKAAADVFWCPRCNVALTKQSCLKCEMEIKGLLK